MSAACCCPGPWYRGALAVVAPIRSGSGMKTKVAEALMHGKRVVGLPEAFVGYGPEVLAANHCATGAAAMVVAIGALVQSPPPGFDPVQRALYERFHSRAAALAGLARILA